MKNKNLTITTFYRFFAFSDAQIKAAQSQLEELGKTEDFCGLVLLGREGINGTVSGPDTVISKVKGWVRDWVKDPSQIFKDSYSDVHPFHDLKVKVKKEIVTLGRPDLVPLGENHHLSPKEWDEMMEKDDVIVLDTRNDYETKIGKFENAIDMNITDFHDFPVRVKELNLPKDKKILMYCTGGIRCEKAILEMQEQGYNEVYQLDGGILNYLKEFPERKFQGECFVFDYRVAVDQRLNPTRNFRLCPHCGQPANNIITCVKCETKAHVCESCLEISPDKETCSKNCAHHFRIASRSKKPQKEGFRKAPPES